MTIYDDAIALDRDTAELFRSASAASQMAALGKLRESLAFAAVEAAEPLTPATCDPQLREAAVMLVEGGIGSVSMLQRRMKVGYNRASRIMEQLCKLGVVGESKGDKPRELIVRDMLELDTVLNSFSSGERGHQP